MKLNIKKGLTVLPFALLALLGINRAFKKPEPVKIEHIFTHASIDAITGEKNTFFVVEQNGLRGFCQNLKTKSSDNILTIDYSAPMYATHFYRVEGPVDHKSGSNLFMLDCTVEESE